MFDVHIDYLFYEKNLWGNLNLFKLVCVNISLYFLELWMDYLCENLVYVLKTYGKSWLKAQCYISP